MEVTHGQVLAGNDAHVGDVLTILVQLGNSLDHIIQMLLGQLAAVDSETDNVANLCLLLGVFRSYSME